MREAHCHIAAFGESLGTPSLAACASVAECLERVREAAEWPWAWVRMKGARVEGWREARWPTLDELDEACAEKPCVIMSFDHHVAVANSKAIAAAGLRCGDVVPPSGVVSADPLTGKATGLLMEHAAYAAWGAAPEPSTDVRLERVDRALQRFSDLGFTQVHDLHSQDWLGPVLNELERAGRLPVRVWLYPPITLVREVHAGRAAWESSLVKLVGAKVFADGTLNSRTALMLEPYREPLEGPGGGSLGRAMVTDAELDGALATVDALGLHLAVHAIGDGAVRMVLDAWERFREEKKTSRQSGIKPSRRGENLMPALRIEHCELIDEADVPRFARFGVTCSPQPCHLLMDIEVLQRQLPHRLHRVLPLRELIDSGCTPGDLLWFSSDAPIVRPEPEDSIQAAVHRRRAGMRPEESIAPEQSISEDEAWACFGAASP